MEANLLDTLEFDRIKELFSSKFKVAYIKKQSDSRIYCVLEFPYKNGVETLNGRLEFSIKIVNNKFVSSKVNVGNIRNYRVRDFFVNMFNPIISEKVNLLNTGCNMQ